MTESSYTATDLPLSQLVANKQVRQSFKSIKDLASSIRKVGLLNPLVVRPELDDADKPTGLFVIVAGERRYRALCHLRDERNKKRHADAREDPLVACRITSAESPKAWLLSQLAENSARLALRPWEAGEGCHDLARKGYSISDIAAGAGRSESWVKQHMRYHRGLAPQTISKLKQLPSEQIGVRLLERLVRCQTEEGKPDAKEQAKLLAQLLRQPQKRPMNRDTQRRKIARLREELLPQLKAQHFSTVEGILEFLSGNIAFEEIPT